ncbi:peptide/nickel transport system permease protein/oligopeptide transport system permease protein [Virgibacillus subterraneus]|uniref:Peptide/nickel transport system permease protein/oligopeptide transport system permease protein n=2 Tax=Virgibacillus TaxID=84406 RepID=A0A1H0Z7R4_9BACI|nr:MULTISPECIES: ABC transporter permease [Virgibacillus]SDQ23499.1 peptide/nickel transport system permease protein/oligopeptide transport system permease protein [Virgibacillus salinus]SEP88518.1 peptide/nickel transport system permease protein/oligopeptide transport system permease protein [Virgibacillus subterraneus]
MKQFLKRLRQDKVGLIGSIGVLLVIIVGFLAPVIAPYSPEQMFTEHTMEGPSGQFIFGTDEFGRDIFSRIVYGTQVSLKVGLIAVGVGATGGLIFGLLAGYFQGKADQIIMRIMDVFFAFPDILLALTIVAVLGPSVTNTMIAIGIVFTPVFTRVVRGTVISVKENEYITNAVAIGVSPVKIISKHITPNIMAPFIVQITLGLSGAILTEAALSFLGLGVQPPDPSWGVMLNSSRAYMEFAPWTILFPAGAIVFTIFCFNLLGDSLRDILDPKLK